MSERKWSTVSVQYDRAKLEEEIKRLEWHNLPIESAPASQGLALKEIITQLRARCSAVAWNGVFADRYAVLGLKMHYKNADVAAFYLDTGVACEPICHDVEMKAAS